jgi:hypothetical protein
MELGRYSGMEIGRYSGMEIGRYSGMEIGRYSGMEIGRYGGMEIGRHSGMEMKVMRISKQTSAVLIMTDCKRLRNTECSKYLGCVASNDARRTRVIKTRTRYDALSLLQLHWNVDIGVGTNEANSRCSARQ